MNNKRVGRLFKSIVRHSIRASIVKIFCLLPKVASASEIDSDHISTVLQGLIHLLTSTPAKLLFVVSIIGVGYATLYLGQLPKERALAVVVGIGIIFSASYIAQQLGFAV